jgi:hypothetical protein
MHADIVACKGVFIYFLKYYVFKTHHDFDVNTPDVHSVRTTFSGLCLLVLRFKLISVRGINLPAVSKNLPIFEKNISLKVAIFWDTKLCSSRARVCLCVRAHACVCVRV